MNLEPKVTFKIHIMTNGSIQIDGPFGDKMVSYGMLKLAEKSLDKFYQQNESPIPIVPANSIPKNGVQ